MGSADSDLKKDRRRKHESMKLKISQGFEKLGLRNKQSCQLLRGLRRFTKVSRICNRWKRFETDSKVCNGLQTTCDGLQLLATVCNSLQSLATSFYRFAEVCNSLQWFSIACTGLQCMDFLLLLEQFTF